MLFLESISRLAECVIETKKDIEASGVIAPIVGHAGDGNFHAVVLVTMDDSDEVARARAFVDRLVERSISTEGTCTGEHAIGQGKKHFMEPEYGCAASGRGWWKIPTTIMSSTYPAPGSCSAGARGTA